MKIKEGRPKSTVSPFEKFNKIYATIPDTGEPMRFNQIAEKLKPMSRSTISKALDHGVRIELLRRDKISHKNVIYSKPTTKTFLSLDTIEKSMNRWYQSGTSNLELCEYCIRNLRPDSIEDFFKDIKKNNDDELLRVSQAVFLNTKLQFIENVLHKMLFDYIKNPKNIDAKNNFCNDLEFILGPMIKQLMVDINESDIKDEYIMTIVEMGNRKPLKKEYFDAFNNVNIKRKEV